jgi:hypothetical protein
MLGLIVPPTQSSCINGEDDERDVVVDINGDDDE